MAARSIRSVKFSVTCPYCIAKQKRLWRGTQVKNLAKRLMNCLKCEKQFAVVTRRCKSFAAFRIKSHSTALIQTKELLPEIAVSKEASPIETS